MTEIDLKPLIGLGLTNLEAEIYAYLLANSPASGYGIAKGIGKPTANTYKAIESLHAKGAVIVDDDRTRLCRAVPVDELFDLFKNRFENLSGRARAELNKLKVSPGDNRIYQLQTADQVLSRFRKMFTSCRRIVMLDFFPSLVQELRPDIIAAAARKVRITIKVYQPCLLPGVKTIVARNGDQIVQRWPGLWANGVFDGEEYLLAFLSKDLRQVFQAVWSNNQYLSWIYFSEIVYEHMVSDLENSLDAGRSLSEFKRIINKYNQILKLEKTGYEKAATFFL